MRTSPPSAASERVRVEKLVYRGEGLARLEGQVVLVPYVLPGEEIEIQTLRVKKGLLRASEATILEPAQQRIQARCEYFGKCGGCHYQHADYATQLQAKQAILRETLLRLGSLNIDREIKIVSGEPWGYRNRIQLHQADGRMGFHRHGSHQIEEILHCEISSPVVNEVIRALSSAAGKPQWPKFLRSLEVFTNEQNVQLTVVDATQPVAIRFFEWCATFIPNLAAGSIEYRAANHLFRISRGAFFQVNRFLIDELVREVIGDSTGEHALDLYAGVGLFTLPLTERFKRVQAVERGGTAYHDLEWNIHEKAGQVEIVKMAAEDFLANLSEVPALIVADPPRAGLGKQMTSELLRIHAPELVIVSCDPATLARDLKVLSEKYRIDAITLVDLFPQTYHFETVVRLRRTN